MKFTDSHCHLDFDEFSQQRNTLINQCADNNIHQIIVPSIHPKNWDKVLTLANSLYPNSLSPNIGCNIYPCLGIHPWFLEGLNQQDLTALSVIVESNKDKVIAIGEAGIDGGIIKKEDNLAQQIEFFRHQLQLAKQHKLPIIVHHRQSHQHIVPLIKQANLSAGGVIHAFSGSYQQAKEYVDLGFKLGIGGTITYPRARKTINAIKRLPVSCLVLETDAPSMPLFGQQGKENSPLALLDVFNALTEIRDETPEALATQLEENIDQLFFSNDH